MAYLENNTVKLRALEPEDLPLLYRWENNSEWWQVGNSLNPFSKYVLRQYLMSSDKTIYENKQLRLMIDAVATKKAVGMIDLFEFEPHHNKVGVGILVDSSFQQQGYASEALGLLKKYVFDFLGLHSMYAHIVSDNAPSITLFEKQGFIKTGTLKDWVRVKENYFDVFVYQLIKK